MRSHRLSWVSQGLPRGCRIKLFSPADPPHAFASTAPRCVLNVCREHEGLLTHSAQQYMGRLTKAKGLVAATLLVLLGAAAVVEAGPFSTAAVATAVESFCFDAGTSKSFTVCQPILAGQQYTAGKVCVTSYSRGGFEVVVDLFCSEDAGGCSQL